MVRQNAQVQHLRVADEHRGRVAPYLAPEVVAGVAVVQGGGGAGLAGPALHQSVERAQLVLRQRLERKEIQGAGVAVAQVAVEHGQVVDEAFAAGRGRGRNNGVPGSDMVCGQRLMAVQPGDAALLEHPADGGGPGQAGRGVARLYRCKNAVAGDLRPQFFRRQQRGDIFPDRHVAAYSVPAGCWAFSPGLRQRCTRAGEPAARQNGGTSRVTTLPAPIMAPSPMLTPLRTRQFMPIQA